MILTPNCSYGPETLEILTLVAEVYQRKNWHSLSDAEMELVARLEKSGHLAPAAHGFVGRQPLVATTQATPAAFTAEVETEYKQRRML